MLCVSLCRIATAAEYRGRVLFSGDPVPGATITATQGSQHITTITDEDGGYVFPNLTDGSWKIEVAMRGFAPLTQSVTIAASQPPAQWDLKLLPLDQIMAQAIVVKPEAPPPVVAAVPAKTEKKLGESNVPSAPEPQHASEESAQASNNGLLINGSVNNAATSQYTLAPAFGNQRSGGKGLYTGGFALILNNSALDARAYSLSGANTPKPAYSDVTTVLTFGGPIRIPHLLPRGPNFFIAYQWTRDSDDNTASGLVPTAAQRAGNLSNATITAIDPTAAYLLSLYPLPNFTGNPSYNYQVPILDTTHQDAMQSRLDKTIGRKDQFYGGLAFENSRASTANFFGFVDKTDVLGLDSNVNWQHRFSTRFFTNLGFKFSRLRTNVAPFFANKTNIEGKAGPNGITGINTDPINWGPPSLSFSSGIQGLSDTTSSFNRNRTDAGSLSVSWYRMKHNITFGGDFRRQEYNYLSQQNPRGTFTFTGAATGLSDLADFLEGKADTSTVAFGNADKYFRESVYDLFATDDFRVTPELTINAGLRWEYGAPMTELFGRLVNLDVEKNFTAVAPVLASSPTGSLTGQRYPGSLLRPDHLGIEPRVGLSWRPIPGSTVVVRAGYGVYDDTSVYRSTALAMAQQEPLSISTNLNYASCPSLFEAALANCTSVTPDPFGVDPNFRVGYAQTWQLSVQRDLPGALQMTASYLGIKGTRGVQQFLPNTYPSGATNPCPLCPTGFTYRTSNGNSTREAGSLQLRRRLRNGFTATVLYTYSKSIDDDAILGGQGPTAAGIATQTAGNAATAQNWLNLSAERALSSFDQRNLLSASLQYTTGQGIGGGSLMSGWRGRAFKEWTVLGQLTAGSGLPETPVYLSVVSGTSVTGTVRPNRSSASIYAAPTGTALNAAAYAAPSTGQWGNAARDSITGPNNFSFNASLSRTFRVTSKLNLDIRADSTNILNHVAFTAWNTTLNPSSTPGQTLTQTLNPTFGLPAAANAMRSFQLTTRLRF